MNSATFDTNIYISAFQFGGLSARPLGMARAGMFRLDVSDPILNEMAGVLRDKFGWDGYSMQDAKEKVRKIANHVTLRQTLEVVKEDRDDNRILECAVEAGSECIVTEDRDRLSIGEYQGIRMGRAVSQPGVEFKFPARYRTSLHGGEAAKAA